MDARWLPILAAALGVLGGVLGALAGGWIANEGQESQFKSERAAEIQNFRIEAYGNFAGTAEALALTLATDPSEAATETNASEAETETACEPPTTDGTAPVDQESAFREVLVTKARLLLWVEREEVATAAVEATNTLNKWIAALIESNEEQALACAHAYDENIDDFLEVARKEIAATQ